MPKPSFYPDWCTSAPVEDPTSHEDNYDETVSPPIPLTKTQYGFVFKEFPPRQWFNLIFRWIGQWIRYFDANYEEGTYSAFDGTNTHTLQYARCGKLVTIFVPTIGGTFSSSAITLVPTPSAVASIKPAACPTQCCGTAFVYNNGATLYETATVNIDSNGDIGIRRNDAALWSGFTPQPMQIEPFSISYLIPA
jgi:hypothetical protein